MLNNYLGSTSSVSCATWALPSPGSRLGEELGAKQ